MIRALIPRILPKNIKSNFFPSSETMSICKLRVSNAPGPDYALLGLAAVSKNSLVKTSHKAGNREIGYIKGNGSIPLTSNVPKWPRMTRLTLDRVKEGWTHLKVGSNYLTVTKEKENKLREDEIGLSGPQAIFTKFVEHYVDKKCWR